DRRALAAEAGRIRRRRRRALPAGDSGVTRRRRRRPPSPLRADPRAEHVGLSRARRRTEDGRRAARGDTRRQHGLRLRRGATPDEPRRPRRPATLAHYGALRDAPAGLYEGYNDLRLANRRVFRRDSAIFRLTGYFPFLPLV